VSVLPVSQLLPEDTQTTAPPNTNWWRGRGIILCALAMAIAQHDPARASQLAVFGSPGTGKLTIDSTKLGQFQEFQQRNIIIPAEVRAAIAASSNPSNPGLSNLPQDSPKPAGLPRIENPISDHRPEVRQNLNPIPTTATSDRPEVRQNFNPIPTTATSDRPEVRQNFNPIPTTAASDRPEVRPNLNPIPTATSDRPEVRQNLNPIPTTSTSDRPEVRPNLNPIPTASTRDRPQIPQSDQIAQQPGNLRLPLPPVRVCRYCYTTGGSSISTPTAFGAQEGDGFVGASYQSRTRFTNTNDGGVGVGFGLGEREQVVALETTVNSFSTFREGFGRNCGVSFKVHHLFPDKLAIALGVENAITWGTPDGGRSVYGVVTKVFQINENLEESFNFLTLSVGLGGGRFRSEKDVTNRIGSVNIFASTGLKVVNQLSLIAEWTGQNLNFGAAITPFPDLPLVITPALADLTGSAGNGTRFILGVGYAFSF